MGNSSTKLKPPKDYDEVKFNIIKNLYHELDTDGDRVIIKKELLQVCDKYYSTIVEGIKKKMENLEVDEKKEIEFLNENLKNLLLNFEEKCFSKNSTRELTKDQKEQYYELKLDNLKLINNTEKSFIEKKLEFQIQIELIENLTQDEKAQKMKDEMVGKKKEEVEFKKFFKFFKDKNEFLSLYFETEDK